MFFFQEKFLHGSYFKTYPEFRHSQFNDTHEICYRSIYKPNYISYDFPITARPKFN